MNRKRWLLVILLVGCAAAPPTMNVTIPGHTMHSSANGNAVVTISDADYSEPFQHGVVDPETGLYPYVVNTFVVENVPSGTYTGTVSVTLG